MDLSEYLGSCEVIDVQAATVTELARQLKADDVRSTVGNCFNFVRDEIKHSADFELDPVTCSASDVAKHGTGYCYAKSHLLCALLRALGIPAGLCYQRLSLDGVGPPYCLHGLNAVHLAWLRVVPHRCARESNRD